MLMFIFLRKGEVEEKTDKSLLDININDTAGFQAGPTFLGLVPLFPTFC